MPGSTQGLDFAETQKIAANLIASTFCNSGTQALLDAQADLLKGMQSAMTEWLHRRREGIDDAYRLVARMRESRDVSEIWKAQQDWAAGALQRLAADVVAYPVLFATASERAGEHVARGAAESASDARQTVGEMARRAAEVMPRPAKPKVPAEAKVAEDATAH